LSDLKILCDSCCDLSDELAKELNAERAVPFHIEVGGEYMVDDDNLSVPDLLKKMKKCTSKMSSACPSPEYWKDVFMKAGGGFAITISGKLSGMYQSAKIGLEAVRNEVSGFIGHIFDSKSAACGEVLVAYKIRQFEKKGLPFDSVVKEVENFISNMKTFFVLDDVSNLVKNGRMSKITGALVSVLGIKPVLGAKNGEIELYGKVRGSSNIAGKLVDTIAECGRKIDGDELVITHCNNHSLVEELTKQINDRFDFGRIMVLETKGLSSFYACDKGIILSF